MRKRIPANSLKFATVRCEYVLHPLALATVGQADDEPAWRSKDVYGDSVDLPRSATHMGEHAKARKPACEQPGDPVRECNVDLRQPSLPKPHHQNACGGDGDDYDG